MKDDPIVKEIRNTRQKLFKQCGDDLNKYLDWLKGLEKKHKDRLVSLEEIHGHKKQETTI
jgi:hypothetical protein